MIEKLARNVSFSQKLRVFVDNNTFRARFMVDLSTGPNVFDTLI